MTLRRSIPNDGSPRVPVIANGTIVRPFFLNSGSTIFSASDFHPVVVSDTFASMKRLPEKASVSDRSEYFPLSSTIAPGTTLEACADALPQVDGLLVMLLEPGSRGRPDSALLAKVSRVSAAMPVGVDGGVGEGNLGDVLAAGATYVVIGRHFFPVTTASSKEEP